MRVPRSLPVKRHFSASAAPRIGSGREVRLQNPNDSCFHVNERGCAERPRLTYFVEKLGCHGRGFGVISCVNAVQLGGFRLDAGAYGVFAVLDRWFSLK